VTQKEKKNLVLSLLAQIQSFLLQDHFTFFCETALHVHTRETLGPHYCIFD